MFERYEVIRKQRRCFDNLDLVSHLHKQLQGEGYQGVSIMSIFRDEVRVSNTAIDSKDMSRDIMMTQVRIHVCMDLAAVFSHSQQSNSTV